MRPRSAPREAATSVEAEIISLAAGGEGVARIDGKVLFVSGAYPGDRVSVRITRNQARYMRGTLERILEPSPQRRPPLCPVADRCGGCPWMGLAESAQESAKAEIVAEALVRIGGQDRRVVAPLVGSPQPLGYRNRVRLQAIDHRIGFRKAGSRSLADITHCPVARPELNVLLGAVRERLSALLPLADPLQIEMSVSEEGTRYLAISGRPAKDLEDFGSGSDASLFVKIDPRPLEAGGVPRLHFAQANALQNERMVAAVAEALRLEPTNRLLDLFAGDGNFSRSLIGRVREVAGIELNPAAVAEANARVGAAHVEALPAGKARYQVGDALEAVEEACRQGETFDRVILNPPRAGAFEVCRQLPTLRPGRIVYVSCDPATLARDIRRLTSLGYVLETVTPFDIMPQTAHVESVAVLQLPVRSGMG